MDDSNDRHEKIDGILRETYESTEPQDSWQALRERIDAALLQHGKYPRSGRLQAVFWRRAAQAMAACFLAATGLLLYVITSDRGDTSLGTVEPAAAPVLLTQAQTERLIQAFSQVRGLFSDHQPWLMIDSAGNSQIGLTPHGGPAGHGARLIVIRLMLQENGGLAGRRYADVVACSQQQISLAMPTTAGPAIDLHLTATLRDDGGIDIDFTAHGGDSHGSRTARLNEDAFTPLARVHIGPHGFSLGAMAKPVQFEERS